MLVEPSAVLASIRSLTTQNSEPRVEIIKALEALRDPQRVKQFGNSSHICDIAASVLEAIGTPEALAVVAVFKNQQR